MIKEMVEVVHQLRETEKAPNYDYDYTNKGMEHIFWTTINSHFPPPIVWRYLSGAEKGQIIRAAKILDNERIPYNSYALFLKKFNKGRFIHRNPLTITAYNSKSDKYPILNDFICIVNYLVGKYSDNPHIIEVLDKVYTNILDCYEHSIIRINYVADSIESALENTGKDTLIKLLREYELLDEYLDRINKLMWKSTSIKVGFKESINAKMLVKEFRIRKGREQGQADPSLNKYFTKTNNFNKKALDIVKQ